MPGLEYGTSNDINYAVGEPNDLSKKDQSLLTETMQHPDVLLANTAQEVGKSIQERTDLSPSEKKILTETMLSPDMLGLMEATIKQA